MTEKQKAALRQLFEKHDPPKVTQIGKLMANYAGKEEAFLKAVYKKYGDTYHPSRAGGGSGVTSESRSDGDVRSKASSSRSGPAAAATDIIYRSQLKAFFEKHDPSEVGQISKLLEHYAGKEEKFIAALAIDKLLEDYAGKEEKFIAALYKKYGEEPASATATAGRGRSSAARSATPTASAAAAQSEAISGIWGSPSMAVSPARWNVSPARSPNYRSQIQVIYALHAPHKMSSVDTLLAVNAGREPELINQLKIKYEQGGDMRGQSGAISGVWGSQSMVTSPARRNVSPARSVPCQNYRNQIQAIYAEPAPSEEASGGGSSARSIDKLLERCAGEEAKSIAALGKKCGVEPPQTSAASAGSSPSSAASATGSAGGGGAGRDYRSQLQTIVEKHDPANLGPIAVASIPQDAATAAADHSKGRVVDSVFRPHPHLENKNGVSGTAPVLPQPEAFLGQDPLPLTAPSSPARQRTIPREPMHSHDSIPPDLSVLTAVPKNNAKTPTGSLASKNDSLLSQSSSSRHRSDSATVTVQQQSQDQYQRSQNNKKATTTPVERKQQHKRWNTYFGDDLQPSMTYNRVFNPKQHLHLQSTL